MIEAAATKAAEEWKLVKGEGLHLPNAPLREQADWSFDVHEETLAELIAVNAYEVRKVYVAAFLAVFGLFSEEGLAS